MKLCQINHMLNEFIFKEKVEQKKRVQKGHALKYT